MQEIVLNLLVLIGIVEYIQLLVNFKELHSQVMSFLFYINEKRVIMI